MIDYVETARRVLEQWQTQQPNADPGTIPPPERWPESLRELAQEQAGASGDEEAARQEVWLSWEQWKASELNRLFLEYGRAGKSGQISRETVKNGLNLRFGARMRPKPKA